MAEKTVSLAIDTPTPRNYVHIQMYVRQSLAQTLRDAFGKEGEGVPLKRLVLTTAKLYALDHLRRQREEAAKKRIDADEAHLQQIALYLEYLRKRMGYICSKAGGDA
jgi:hypothetical protein